MLLKKINALLIALLLIILTACTPNIHPANTSISSGQLLNTVFITPDGTKLPLKSWQPTKNSHSVIIALHGFNDYSHFFHHAGQYFSQHKTLSYAYDQRGFGASATRGLWAGVETYRSDLVSFIRLVKNRHPTLPLYLLGESMGGAIIISTLAQTSSLPINGIILAAPAVWSRQAMPWYQTALLWTLSHTIPWMTLSGSNLGIKPSDNIDMLIALGRDPLMIKETRVESIYGLTNLMDHALSSAENISVNTLFLYGEKDEIIPKEPIYQFIQKLTANTANQHLIALYKDGYHMLLRDLQASILWNDINTWINSVNTPLPSGADKRAVKLINQP